MRVLAALFSAALVSAAFQGSAPVPCPDRLPARYFCLLNAAVAHVDFEQQHKSHYVPGALLTAAVLYAKPHRDNPRAGDSAVLELALKLGDVLAAESETGMYTKRADHHRDTYMWLEAYRLLEPKLGESRRARWRGELIKLLGDLARQAAERQDRPAYTSPFGVSVNHTALYSATVFLAGRILGKPDWEALGRKIMHRYAAEEQSADGFWGEHSPNGPTTAYDYLTVAGVALYWEHSQDPAALAALRRSTDFHKYFTYPDGFPVMITDDRRRHAYISPWGHFGFSHFDDGRRYAEFLTAFFQPGGGGFEHIGRLAQDALYYHEGRLAAIPQDAEHYAHRMAVPAGIRKSGPWVVCLSGLIGTEAISSRYYLDRQSSLEVFHQKYGLIISGANSKRQPELATFRERVRGRWHYMPEDTRLRMSEPGDRLSLAYDTFVAEVRVEPVADARLPFYFTIKPKGKAEEAYITLQLCLKPGEAFQTAGGRTIMPGEERITLAASGLGGRIRHRGWTLSWDAPARLDWPVYPYNPYGEGPEKSLEFAVGALSFPLGDINFTVEAR